MRGFSQWSLIGKIISVGVATMLGLSIALFCLYSRSNYAQTIEAYVQKARAICLTAESARDEMEDKWKLGVFDAAMLRKFSDEKNLPKVLATVPVVSAMKAAEHKAQEGGYKFKVPKQSPRNPANQPDERESLMLARLSALDRGETPPTRAGEPDMPVTKTGQDLEGYFIDPQVNAVRYFRAVRLSETCLYCHGDPALSRQYWGNDQGVDPTGVKLENWRAGELHGAFEITQFLHTADQERRQGLLLAGAVAALGIFIASLLYFGVIRRFVVQPINRIVDGLNDGSNQVAMAAGEISAASGSLAENSTSQAASLEETSAALEEIASMTRQNADGADEANRNTEASRSQIQKGSSEVANMTQAMSEINSASEKIGKIIQTIEEIAFQTNLLALNAAVEAARAGEAGKGFAVVADEVRNLAQRSAQAARDTTGLIEGAVSRIKRGDEIAQKLAADFKEIETGAGRVAGLVSGIAAASREQAQGVDQVNIAVAQIDKITQSIAASSEESASAAEQLNAQSETLKQTVGELLRLVTGGRAN